MMQQNCHLIHQTVQESTNRQMGAEQYKNAYHETWQLYTDLINTIHATCTQNINISPVVAQNLQLQQKVATLEKRIASFERDHGRSTNENAEDGE